MSTVGNVTTMAPSNTTSTSSSSQLLSQQDFLKLMVAQFQAQDPLASGGDSGSGSGSGASDYVNQLMSMTNLTTMQTMSAQQSLILAGSLPGATVTITKPDNTTTTGTVTGTTIDSTGLNVQVNGGLYPFTEITALTPASAAAANTSTPATPSN